MLRFLYTTVPGRMLLKPLTSRGFSRLAGKFMDSRASVALIKPFVRKNRIDLSEYEPAEYRSFNEFFIRKVRPECRPVAPDGLIAPCDGLLSAYKIDGKTRLNIKNSVYSIQTLLGNDPRAAEFAGGTCLVFRLCVDNYHRYHFFDDCAPEPSRFIPGILHTVRPIALENVPVFHQNCREVTFLHTKNHGLAAQIEVGAMLVGKIHNHKIISSHETPIGDENCDGQSSANDRVNGKNYAVQSCTSDCADGENRTLQACLGDCVGGESRTVQTHIGDCASSESHTSQSRVSDCVDGESRTVQTYIGDRTGSANRAAQIHLGDCASSENCAAQTAIFPARRGDEKGYFLYGGSTVVLLLNQEAAHVPESLYKSTADNQETPVKYGQRLSDR